MYYCFFPFYKWRNGGKDSLSNWGTATELVADSGVLFPVPPPSVVLGPACTLESSGQLVERAMGERWKFYPALSEASEIFPLLPTSKVQGHPLPVFPVLHTPTSPLFHGRCRVFSGLLQSRPHPFISPIRWGPWGEGRVSHLCASCPAQCLTHTKHWIAVSQWEIRYIVILRQGRARDVQKEYLQ